jgi:putative ABC transport system permease protein
MAIEHGALRAARRALGLAVASIGVYGVVRFAVVERWHELGVRTALGGSQRQLMSTIAGEAARLVALGIVTGAGIAWMVSRAMTSILFGIDATDALTFVAVAGGLAVVAGAAAYFPARAAIRADPSVLLRSL